jgi:hypothetical protein
VRPGRDDADQEEDQNEKENGGGSHVVRLERIHSRPVLPTACTGDATAETRSLKEGSDP